MLKWDHSCRKASCERAWLSTVGIFLILLLLSIRHTEINSSWAERQSILCCFLLLFSVWLLRARVATLDQRLHTFSSELRDSKYRYNLPSSIWIRLSVALNTLCIVLKMLERTFDLNLDQSDCCENRKGRHRSLQDQVQVTQSNAAERMVF